MPRSGLDKAAVVEAAAKIADQEGIDHVTLARLAQELNVRSPSLYNHVDGLEGLRRELALLGTNELHLRLTHAAVGKSRRDAIIAMAKAYRAYAQERPGVYAISLRAAPAGDKDLAAAGSAVVDVVFRVLESYGLKGKEAVHATRGLRAIVHGFVSLEAQGGFGLPITMDESFERLVQTFADGLERMK